ncbi:MAG: hypothetical protein QNK23_08465 [Crocinitomicaceae bacterium]|nr:hypothetical protein [Crocinitomicaceae bacterium]
MTETETISWILLAVSLGSEVESVDYAGIKMLADGINHAIPLDKEMQRSLKWLVSNGVINKIGKKYNLSETGKELYSNASGDNRPISEIWNELEVKIKAYT